MTIALILVSVYAYAITGYTVQKAERCKGWWKRLYFGVTWPVGILCLFLYRDIDAGIKEAQNFNWKKAAKERARLDAQN